MDVAGLRMAKVMKVATASPEKLRVYAVEVVSDDECVMSVHMMSMIVSNLMVRGGEVRIQAWRLFTSEAGRRL